VYPIAEVKIDYSCNENECHIPAACFVKEVERKACNDCYAQSFGFVHQAVNQEQQHEKVEKESAVKE
jgi:hypothetical protein